ncbi:MAG: hypothetical protein ITG07_10520 [Candidimonas sp.]|nr:hypothetical protein [Candidimonas sp.]
MKELLEKLYRNHKHYLPERLVHSPLFFRLRDALLNPTPAKTEQLIQQRLRHTLLIAKKNVPFYKGLPITTKTIANESPLELLNEFPFIEKDQIMDDQRSFINCKKLLLLSKYATSGGSSGRGIGIWRSKTSSDIEKLFFDVRWGALGYSATQSTILRIGADARRRQDEHPVWRSGHKLMLSPYHVNSAHLSLIFNALSASTIDFIHAYPSIMAELTRLLQSNSLPPPVKPQAIFLASEPSNIEQIHLIQRYWNCGIVLHYGLAERTNLAFYYHNDINHAVTYKLEPLYSISENYPDTTEIVGTSLWNDVMPLIRYRTKDHGIIKDSVIHSLDGRSQDFLTDRNGNLIPGTSVVIDEVTWSKVRQYQVYQSEPGAVKIKVVPRYQRIEDDFLSYILNQQRARWGDFFDISVVVCDSIPLTPAGKTKLVAIEPS